MVLSLSTHMICLFALSSVYSKYLFRVYMTLAYMGERIFFLFSKLSVFWLCVLARR